MIKIKDTDGKVKQAFTYHNWLAIKGEALMIKLSKPAYDGLQLTQARPVDATYSGKPLNTAAAFKLAVDRYEYIV